MNKTWNTKKFLSEIYRAVKKRNLAQLESLVKALPDSSNLDEQLDTLTFTEWKSVISEKEQQAKQNRQRLVLSLLALIIVLPIIGYVIWRFTAGLPLIPFQNTPTPSPTIEIILPTETPTESPVPIVIPTTPTPETSPTPSITPSPTENPDSAYLVPPENWSNIYPLLPLEVSNVWIIDYSQAQYTVDDIWELKNSVDESAGGKEFRTTGSGNVTVTWEMDRPFLEDGIYQVLYVDTTEYSTSTQIFDIQLDNVSANRFQGTNEVIFNSVKGGQASDDWLSLGYYEVSAGQSLKVDAEVNDLSQDETLYFAVDRLMIARLSNDAVTMLTFPELPTELPIVYLSDDNRALYEIYSGGWTSNNPEWSITSDSPAWAGSYHTRNQWDAQIRAIWPSIGRLSAGSYQLFAWIPAEHATVNVRFETKEDGTPSSAFNTESKVQGEYSNQWVSIGTLTVYREAAVSVIIHVAKLPADTTGEIGVDAVILIALDRPINPQP